MPSSRQELLFAYRWPIALVGSSLILGGAVLVLAQTAVRLLSQPIPIAIEGGQAGAAAVGEHQQLNPAIRRGE